jgi:hypothetical protein
MDTSAVETDWWWIDYLENELDVALERDLESLLKHSAEDRDTFENFRLLKEWVKASDTVNATEIEARLPRTRARIMAEIDRVSSVQKRGCEGADATY